MTVWKYLLSSQCLNLRGDNLNEILEVHQIWKRESFQSYFRRSKSTPTCFNLNCYANALLTYICKFFVPFQRLNNAGVVVSKTEFFNPVKVQCHEHVLLNLEQTENDRISIPIGTKFSHYIIYLLPNLCTCERNCSPKFPWTQSCERAHPWWVAPKSNVKIEKLHQIGLNHIQYQNKERYTLGLKYLDSNRFNIKTKTKKGTLLDWNI